MLKNKSKLNTTTRLIYSRIHLIKNKEEEEEEEEVPQFVTQSMIHATPHSNSIQHEPDPSIQVKLSKLHLVWDSLLWPLNSILHCYTCICFVLFSNRAQNKQPIGKKLNRVVATVLLVLLLVRGQRLRAVSAATNNEAQKWANAVIGFLQGYFQTKSYR